MYKKLLLIACAALPVQAFDLAYFEALAQRMPESVQQENIDPLWPSFNSFYQHMQPTWYMRLWCNIQDVFGYHQRDIFEDFPSLIIRALHAVHAMNVRGRDRILRLTPEPGSRLLVVGEVSGAFHSLVRDVREWERSALLDKNLNLSKKTYVVFLSNAIGRSPYPVQTLALIAQLIINNPTQVLYLAGPQEDGWIHESLTKQVAYFWSDAAASIKKSLEAFFAELPRAVSLSYVNEFKQSKKIYLAYAGAPLAPYQKDPNPDFDYFPNVTTQIKCEEFEVFFRPVPGVQMLMPQQGTVSWSVLSCPTVFGKDVRQFFNDAFAVVHVNQPSRHWTIESHVRDTRDKKTFSIQTYDFMTGQLLDAKQAAELANAKPAFAEPPADVVGVDHGNEYDFVLMCDLTNTAAVYGNHIRAGMFVRWLSEMQQHGGVGGKFLRWIVLDDKYVPTFAMSWAERMLDRYKADIVSTLGAASTMTFLPYIKSGKILLAFSCIGSDFLYDPSMKYILNMRQSYAVEDKVLVSQAVNNLRCNRIAIVFQDDAYGAPQKDLALQLLKGNSAVQTLLVSHARNSPELERHLENILAFDPDCFLLFAADPGIEELVRVVGVSFLANRTLLTNSGGSDMVVAYLKKRGLDVTVTRAMPTPKRQGIEFVNVFRKLHSTYANDVSVDDWSMEGYLAMSLIIDALKNVKPPITKEKIIEYVESLHNIDYQGLPFDFDQKKRLLFDGVWLVLNNGERVMIRERDLGQLGSV